VPALAIIAALAALLYWGRKAAEGEARAMAATVRGNFRPSWGRWRVTDRVIVLGLSGTGKTWLAAKLAREAPRVLAFDIMGDLSRHGFTTTTVADLVADPTPLLASRFHLAAAPDEDFVPEDLEDVVTLARSAGNMVLLLDEVGDYRQESERLLNRLARNGRHDGVVPVFVSQVAVDIPRTVRRQMTRLYSFPQVDADDLAALEERTGPGWAAQAMLDWKKGKVATWTLPSFPQARLSDASDGSTGSAAGTGPTPAPRN